MYIRSGEWVTILGDKLKSKIKVLKSLRLCIILLLLGVGYIPCALLEKAILENFEEHAVELKTAEIQNQCTILVNQLGSNNYIANPVSDVINAELSQFSNIYNGRVLIIDEEFGIIKDTYDLEQGKTVVSENVIQCFNGKSTSYYDRKNRYIEVTMPIMGQGGEEAQKAVTGVMLVSVSADTIVDSQEILKEQAHLVQLAIVSVLLVVAVISAAFLVRPLKRFTKRIEDVTEGYESDLFHENTYMETEQMSDAFNKMMNRLKVLDETRQEFVSNVSHELKTPITSMKVLADSLLAQEGVPVELYQEFMEDIAKEIDRENAIINDLLSLVKMDKNVAVLNIAPANMNELVEHLLKRLRPIADKRNIELVFESFRPVTAEVDETKLSLALSNLMENAVKYNKEDGWVHVSLNADHKYCYVKVEDSGIGIPKDELEHIFERFYRVDKSHSSEIGGTGLGLAIARSAIAMHRGSIKVHSEEQVGTVFNVRIPLTHAAS